MAATSLPFHYLSSTARVALVAGMLYVGFSCTAHAEDIVSNVDDERARIFFNSNAAMEIIPSMVGNQLSLQFNADEQIDMEALLSNLRPYVISGAQPNGHQIILSLSDAYPVRTFTEGKRTGVELLLPKKSSTTPHILSTEGEEIGIDANADAPDVAQDSTQVTTDKSILTTTPEAVRPAPATKAKEKIKPHSAIEQKDKKQQLGEAINAIPIPLAKPSVIATEKQNTAKSPLQQVMEKADADKLVVSVKNTPIASTMYIPFHERTAVATFQYGQDIFAVFSAPTTIDTEKLRTTLPSFLTSVTQLYHPTATILRFTTATHTPIASKAHQTGKGHEWMIEATRRPLLPKHITVPELLTAPPIKPHVMMDVMQLGDLVTFAHPVTGEEISVLPSYEGDRGVYPERILPELTVLRTGQGVAFTSNEPDAIKILRLRQGIRLTKQGGLTLTPSIAAIPEEALQQAEQSRFTFYPYAEWKAEDPKNFVARQHALFSEISFADEKKIPSLRLALAQLYMTEGLYTEALGLLELINMQSPEFYLDNQLVALSAAANFMMGRLGEAAQLFNSDTIKDEEEMALWHRVMEIAGGSKHNIDYFDYNKRYIQFYPPDMRRRIGMLIADQALTLKKYSLAQKIIGQLAADGVADGIEDYAAYMEGRIQAELGNIIQAEALLVPLTEKLDNNFIRARAAFSLATSRYKAGLIDRPTLIATLEPVQLLWRGDNFELGLLNLLGELYINNGQYLEGLRAWRDVMTYFPTSDKAIYVAGRMAEIFVDIFNDGIADEMTPLAALALYYEFRDLTPIGAAGDKMVQQLADRLAGVDLLTKAAKLLEYQVTYRLEKEERSSVGAKLALIYLLNREPEKTLQVLELTGYGDNDELLTARRNHLAAIAYGKLGKWQRAMNLLRDDYSREAKFIRSDIYWDIKDWQNLAVTVEDMLMSRPVATNPLGAEEMQALLRLCVAYSFMGDSQQLSYLRDYFTPLVTETSDKQVFAFLTSATDIIDRDNISRVVGEINQMKGFLDNYRVSAEKKPLSNLLATTN